MEKSFKQLKLINTYLVVPCDILRTSTKFSDTLQVTEEKQYRSHGLLHITDACFDFFMKLEQIRVTYLNNSQLAEHGQNLTQLMFEKLKDDVQLRDQWIRQAKLDTGNKVSIF